MNGLLIILVLGFLLFWLFVIRPQRRRQNQQVSMQESLRPGVEVVTAGGLYGTVTGADEDEVLVEIADGVVVRVARRAIAGVIPPDEPELEPEEADESEPEREPVEAEHG